MAIVPFSKENSSYPIYIFSGKKILVKKTDGSENLSLPDAEVLNTFISNHFVSDSFTETEKKYSAAFLKEGFVLPPDCELIMLREYFWRTKDYELSARAHGFLSIREIYRFCPTCGGKLEDDSYFTAKKCSSCGRLLFPRIEPAVIVLVSKGDEVLLVKSKTNASGFYSCVAGFVEHGECIEQTVVREVKEETSIDVKNVCYAGSQPWPFPDQLMLAFTADYAGGEIKIQEEEIEAAAWFKRDSLPPTPPAGSVAYNLIHGFKKPF